MKTRISLVILLATTLTMAGAVLTAAQPAGAQSNADTHRPEGPCDIYAAAGNPCVAAHSTTRALYAAYNGPLYQVKRQSDGRTLDIDVVEPNGSDGGGYADAAAQDRFCANTWCWITKIYDQSPKHNDLTQAPRGGFSGPALGGFNNLPIADMAPVTVLGHKVYGVFIEPGMGLRDDDTKGVAVDDQAEGQYWVVNGQHFNSGCCYDYGNAEIDSHDDGAGTMETAYFGNAPWWYGGNMPGPWVMTDQENNLVGCVNPDGTKRCVQLPNITWRFVTAMAKGEPHHWTSMGGDAQRGPLQVMFSGPRVNTMYDPMRKQGAILLGNGGDNSNGSQGTFYEGAVTAAGTFPTDATDQKVQANIVAAGYRVQALSLAPAAAATLPTGLQTFSPGSSQESTVTFTNTTGSPAKELRLSLVLPEGWSASEDATKRFTGPIAPGERVTATFKVTSGAADFNGDLAARASWTDAAGAERNETTTEKVRNVEPVRINEFRISSGPPSNSTDSFIELYNAGDKSVDLSKWSLTVHPTQQAIFSSVTIPDGTTLRPGGFYLLGLADSGLAGPAHAGDRTIFVRNTAGMKTGDTLQIGAGSNREARKIASVGTAATNHTTVWQPLPDGPVITVRVGATNIPVMSVEGFKPGEKIALGYGSTYPTDPVGRERYEVATVTRVGTPGTQNYLAEDAAAGSTNIRVMSVDGISVGDKIRLDIDSKGHGIEVVTVKHVGTAASHTELTADVKPGASTIRVRDTKGFAAGEKMIVGMAKLQTVKITGVNSASGSIQFKPALAVAHLRGEDVVQPGAGLDLEAPLKFAHADNLPFSDRGTGISFEPATRFAHISNEPVQALGTGITLDSGLAHNHGVNAVVRDASVTTAGYQGKTPPNQWFGGPELTTQSPLFGHIITARQGSLVLRNGTGLVVDSLNYGGLVDPWAAEGYQAASGFGASGCYVPTPGAEEGLGRGAAAVATDTSAGRFSDGVNTDSNCSDFRTAPATTLAAAAEAGATNIKVASVDGFAAGESIRIDTGTRLEESVIASVGAAGATTVRSASSAGATTLMVEKAEAFRPGDTLAIGSGADFETAIVASSGGARQGKITVTGPLHAAHAAGEPVDGTGITLAAPLMRSHAGQTMVTGSVATPGAPNRYYKRPE